MKRFVLAIALTIVAVSSTFALTLKEGYEQISKLPNIKGIESGQTNYDIGGWISSIPFETAHITYKVHEVGTDQTSFYGGKVEEIIKQLPKDEFILGAMNWQNIICFFAKPLDNTKSELLIIIDQAYQGKTTAIIGSVDNQTVKALKDGKIQFTSDHKIVVDAPIMICN